MRCKAQVEELDSKLSMTLLPVERHAAYAVYVYRWDYARVLIRYFLFPQLHKKLRIAGNWNNLTRFYPFASKRAAELQLLIYLQASIVSNMLSNSHIQRTTYSMFSIFTFFMLPRGMVKTSWDHCNTWQHLGCLQLFQD